MIRVRSILALAAGVFVPALFASQASAQVTVTKVTVTVGNATDLATYCDTSQTCSNKVWDLGGGVPLNPGETLVLAQTAFLDAAGGNFDTSDRVRPTTDAPAPVQLNCSPTSACITTVFINGVQVYQSTAAGDPLSNFNGDSGTTDHQEANPFVQVATQPTFTLALGYSDNEHGTTNPVTCPATGCFPSPWDGTATHFIGHSVDLPGQGGSFCSTGCYDGGALLITGVLAPPPPGCGTNGNTPCQTVTQGGWGAAAHGNNPGTILNAFYAAHPGYNMIIGCSAVNGFRLTFNSANAIRGFLPQGGTPGVLNANALNPTTSAAKVFGGQVLALEISVTLSNAGNLPTGLGGFVLTAGTPTNPNPAPGSVGKTIGQVLADANNAVGGCGFPSYAPNASALNDLVNYINNLFD